MEGTVQTGINYFQSFLKKFTFTPTHFNNDESDTSKEEKNKETKTAPSTPAQPAPTPADGIVRAIEGRSPGDISMVEYEYYNKLLRDRVKASERDNVNSPTFYRPTPVHPPNTSPATIVHTFLHNKPNVESPIPMTLSNSIKRSRSESPPQGENGKGEEDSYLDRQPAPKKNDIKHL